LRKRIAPLVTVRRRAQLPRSQIELLEQFAGIRILGLEGQHGAALTPRAVVVSEAVQCGGEQQASLDVSRV
jgi:hypothetical protein